MLELKPYQKAVLTDIRRYLNYVATPMKAGAAFQRFWEEHPSGKVTPQYNTALEPYKHQKLGDVPNVCVKVPTGGGKTFIGCHALATTFDFYAPNRPRVAVWLVPSRTIYDQTLATLRNPEHPYRQALNTLFQHNIQILDKNDLLNGINFNEVCVQSQVSVVVLTFQSLRANNKEERKLYQQNGNYLTFAQTLNYTEPPHDQTDETSPMHILRALNPVVIVDESHNAESDLSVDMLGSLNPSFVLDLTATPRNSANVISFTNTYELKRENMVKLPIFVYNQPDKRIVIQSAIDFQARLEGYAIAAEAKGSPYVRPIVLFQAQSKSGKEDIMTFEQLKKDLVKDFNLPAEQIAIKTATINELKNHDLLSRTCPIRYIITVNALKEGWDCSFAYILASLADRHSDTDVTQVVGRILRQPYARSHAHSMLNSSYVFTASAQFRATLQRIIDGLKLAGFSERDYKAEDYIEPPTFSADPLPIGEQSTINFDDPFAALQTPITEQADDDTVFEMDETLTVYNEPIKDVSETVEVSDTLVSSTKNTPPSVNITSIIDKIEKTALAQQITYQEQAQAAAVGNGTVAPELQQNMKQTILQPRFAALVADLHIPQFYIRSNNNILFGNGEHELLTETKLMDGFNLANEDTKIDFSALDDNIAKVDLDAEHSEHKPIWQFAKDAQKELLLSFIHLPEKRETVVNTFIDKMLKIIGNLYPIADTDIRVYLKRLFQGFSAAQFEDLLEKQSAYALKIKTKILMLSRAHREQVFKEWLKIGKITLQNGYTFPEKRPLYKVTTADGIANSLYNKEESMNSWEEDVIGSVANLETVAFWTRNEAKKSFFVLNGHINHYPDFIALTKSGKIILIETKGDFLDGSDSRAKMALGAEWEKAMRGQGFYFMIFKDKKVEGGFQKADLLRILRGLS